MKSRLDIYGDAEHPVYEGERYGLNEQKLYEGDKYQVQSTTSWKGSTWPMTKLPENMDIGYLYSTGYYQPGYLRMVPRLPVSVDFSIYRVFVKKRYDYHGTAIELPGYFTYKEGEPIESFVKMPYDNFVDNYGGMAENRKSYIEAITDDNFSFPNLSDEVIPNEEYPDYPTYVLSYDDFLGNITYHFEEPVSPTYEEAAEKLNGYKEFEITDILKKGGVKPFVDTYTFTGKILRFHSNPIKTIKSKTCKYYTHIGAIVPSSMNINTLSYDYGEVEECADKLVAVNVYDQDWSAWGEGYPNIEQFKGRFTNDLYLIQTPKKGRTAKYNYVQFTDASNPLDYHAAGGDGTIISGTRNHTNFAGTPTADTQTIGNLFFGKNDNSGNNIHYKHAFPYGNFLDESYNVDTSYELYVKDIEGNYGQIDLEAVGQAYMFFGKRVRNNDGTIAQTEYHLKNEYLIPDTAINSRYSSFAPDLGDIKYTYSITNEYFATIPIRLVGCSTDKSKENRNPLKVQLLTENISGTNGIMKSAYIGFDGYTDKVYDDGYHYIPNVCGTGKRLSTKQLHYYFVSEPDIGEDEVFEKITTLERNSYVPCSYHYELNFEAIPGPAGWRSFTNGFMNIYQTVWENREDVNIYGYLKDYSVHIDDYLIECLVTGEKPYNPLAVGGNYLERTAFHLARNPDDKYTCTYIFVPQQSFVSSTSSRNTYPDNGISETIVRLIGFTKISNYSARLNTYSVGSQTGLYPSNAERVDSSSGRIYKEALRYNDTNNNMYYPITSDGKTIKEKGFNAITAGTYYEGSFQTDPVRGRRLGRVSSYDETAYPKDDSVYNGYSYEFIGATTINYAKSTAPIDIIASTSPNKYPLNGIQDFNGTKYGFVSTGQRKVVAASYEPSVLLDNINYSQSIGSSNALAIGSVGGASVTINVLKPLVEVLPYINHEAEIYYYYAGTGGFQSEGLFTFREATENGLNRTIITAYDNVYKLDILAKPLLDKLPLPMSAQQLFCTVCAYCGIPYDPNVKFFNSNAYVTEPFGKEETTCRDVMTGIAEIAVCAIVADIDGKLIFKELVQPEMSRGSRAENTLSLDSSMLQLQKPTGIKYKYHDEEHIVRANSEDDDYLLDYSENPFTFNEDQSITDSLLLDISTQIDSFGELYGFTVNVPANAYGMLCGDSGVISAANVEPRRGIICDKSISSSGVTFVSSGEIISLTRDKKREQDEIENIITEVDNLFHRITIDGITIEDIYYGDIYKRIDENISFQHGSTIYNKNGLLFDISEQFEMLFQGYEHVEVIVNNSVMYAYIQNGVLRFVDSDYLPDKLKNFLETNIYADGNFYQTVVSTKSNQYRDSYSFDTNVLDLIEQGQKWHIENKYFNKYVEAHVEPVEQSYINEQGEVVYNKVNTYNFNTAALMYILGDGIVRSATLIATEPHATFGYRQAGRVQVGDDWFDFLTVNRFPAQSITLQFNNATGIMDINFIGVSTLQSFTIDSIAVDGTTNPYLTVHNSSSVLSLPYSSNGGSYDIYSGDDTYIGTIEGVLDLDLLSQNVVQYKWTMSASTSSNIGINKYQYGFGSFINNALVISSEYLGREIAGIAVNVIDNTTDGVDYYNPYFMVIDNHLVYTFNNEGFDLENFYWNGTHLFNSDYIYLYSNEAINDFTSSPDYSPLSYLGRLKINNNGTFSITDEQFRNLYFESSERYTHTLAYSFDNDVNSNTYKQIVITMTISDREV